MNDSKEFRNPRIYVQKMLSATSNLSRPSMTKKGYERVPQNWGIILLTFRDLK